MKTTLLILAGLSLSAPAFAREAWQNLRINDRTTLTQDITLSGKPFHINGKPVREKRFSGVRLRSGEVYKIVDIIGLDTIHLVLFKLIAARCPNPNASSDMDLILVEGLPPGSKAEVGVQYSAGCKMEIYVETKDLKTPSFLNP